MLGVVVGSALASIALFAVFAPATLTLSERQKQAITQKIATEVLAGQMLYNMDQVTRPAVSFEPRASRNAAETRCEPALVSSGLPAWRVWVNERLAAQHYHRFMTETIPHEVAHLLVCQMDVPRWEDHHDLWATIVRDAGATPVERHDYEETE